MHTCNFAITELGQGKQNWSEMIRYYAKTGFCLHSLRDEAKIGANIFCNKNTTSVSTTTCQHHTQNKLTNRTENTLTKTVADYCSRLQLSALVYCPLLRLLHSANIQTWPVGGCLANWPTSKQAGLGTWSISFSRTKLPVASEIDTSIQRTKDLLTFGHKSVLS